MEAAITAQRYADNVKLAATRGKFRADGGWHISSAMADRTVLSLDQRALAHQALLPDKPECGEDANLDCRGGLPDGCHHAKATEVAGNAAPNFATFEYSSV